MEHSYGMGSFIRVLKSEVTYYTIVFRGLDFGNSSCNMFINDLLHVHQGDLVWGGLLHGHQGVGFWAG